MKRLSRNIEVFAGTRLSGLEIVQLSRLNAEMNVLSWLSRL